MYGCLLRLMALPNQAYAQLHRGSGSSAGRTMTDDSRFVQNLMFMGAILFLVHLVWRFAVYQGKLMR